MKKSKGYRSKSRAILSKKPRQRGKIGLSRILRDHKPGDKVYIILDPSAHKGMPHQTFHGKVGIVRERRGRSFVVDVRVGKGYKTVITRPEHIAVYARGK